ncbi:MAG: histidine kinase [Cyclobacteriaceae bacterium]|nr:histidine kinase [Cyclobacteriaceae bacterium]
MATINPRAALSIPRPLLALAMLLPAGGLFALIHVWYGYEPALAATDTGLSIFLLVTAGVAARSVLTSYFPQSGKLVYGMGLSVALAVFITWLFQQSMLGLIDEERYRSFLYESLPVRAGFNWLVIVSMSATFVLYEGFKEKQKDTQHEIDTVAMVKEAELQKLQLQLQPHFLFNSLNSINALILTQPTRAREMVQQLSDFLRTTLKRADEHWITLDQELHYLNLYLAIEKVRFGHRLEVQTEVDEHIKLWLIPPLLLQPLVENAIKFGLYGTTDKVTIVMQTYRVDNALRVTITNPFDSDMQPPEGSGFGLQGLHRRLYLLYARNDLLTTKAENNHFTVELTLPEKL